MDPAPLLSLLAPLLLALSGGLIALAAEPFLARVRKHQVLPWIVAVACIAAAFAVALAPNGQAYGMLALDAARRWLMLTTLAVTAVAVGGLQASLDRDRFPGGESYALAAVAASGVLLMIMSLDALAAFVGMETAALAIYALVGLRRQRPESGEALLKYLVMGAVFSAIFLYGVALYYGATGSTRFGAPAVAGREALFALGASCMLIGLAFKLGAVPFHAWAPDAYTGAPVAVTGLMGAIVKLGAVALLGSLWLGLAASDGKPVRLDQAVPPVPGLRSALLEPLALLLTILAIASIVIGSFAMLRQSSLRRLVGYSAIANAGFLLLPFILPFRDAAIDLSALWLYAVAYALATAAALAAAAAIAGPDDAGDNLSQLHGRGRQFPLYGAVLSVCLASLAGLPPMLGFLGKFAVLGQTVAAGGWIIALVALIAALAAAAAYLYLLVQLWAGTPRDEQPLALGGDALNRWGSAAAAVLLVALLACPGLLPSSAAVAAPTAASSLSAPPPGGK
ncbi:MAG: proton-conducting transporter membrane subunit [Planctomycetota bacterium]|nr:hypothetical protein [Planctomycetota bacterium]MCX8039004.1 proton-conducting transporter membrane subunit [Planctomycetota bacterium]MDW8372745.1 proton-conducting transporter membrane subunit [Planctomycetota bacterium]